MRALLGALCVLLPLLALGGKFDGFTSCDSCVGAGYGWSVSKQRCGGFSNKLCPAAAGSVAAAGSAAAPVPAVPGKEAWFGDTVHLLVSFCGSGYATTEKMAPYFRSLLFHRSCKVHFHVMADAAAWDSTQELFRSEVVKRWAHVEVTFVPKAENDMWLHKADTLQRSLGFPTQLPACSFVRIWADGILPDLDAVIVMDTNDEIVLGDIADLWSVFAEFDDDDLIGSVLEQTQHYKRFSDKKHQHYDPNWNTPNPVMDEYGFNCGVLLLNLTRLRARGWSADNIPLALATEAINKPALAGTAGHPGDPIRGGKGLRYFGFLAENDVWQYATMLEPHIIHKIPCSWDIILYGGGPGLYSGGSARSNAKGCSCTPIRLMHGTGGSFKKHALGAFHNFYRGDTGMDKGLGVTRRFQPQQIRMDPNQNALPVEQDPHRARHDRLAGAAPSTRTERVHIMMFVCGASYGLKIMHFLKALLFHRSAHIHFHFVADKEARPVLKAEWQKLRQPGGVGSGVVEEVTVDYIKTEEHVKNFEKAYPDKFNKMDYMGSCCRIRLVAEQVLPNIDAVIVLDGGDQLIFDDIARLWAHFRNFDSKQYVGFALEPPGSRWYSRLADRNHPNGDKNGNWEGVYPHGDGVPADELHRGVNAGVQLLNLTRMREQNVAADFVARAHEGTEKHMTLFGHLGDQDVWNYHLIRKPEVVYKLPCAWNAQLGGSRHGLPEQCMPLKILHANAKAFEETESRRQQADGSVTTSMNQPHPLVAYRQFWDDAPLEFLHYQFERKAPSMSDTWVNSHPTAVRYGQVLQVDGSVAGGGGAGVGALGHKHDEV